MIATASTTPRRQTHATNPRPLQRVAPESSPWTSTEARTARFKAKLEELLQETAAIEAHDERIARFNEELGSCEAVVVKMEDAIGQLLEDWLKVERKLAYKVGLVANMEEQHMLLTRELIKTAKFHRERHGELGSGLENLTRRMGEDGLVLGDEDKRKMADL